MSEQEAKGRIRFSSDDPVNCLKMKCSETNTVHESEIAVKMNAIAMTSASEGTRNPSNKVRPQHEHSSMKKEILNSNSQGSSTESGNESMKGVAKTVSLSGSSASGCIDQSTIRNDKEKSKSQTRSSRRGGNNYVEPNKIEKKNNLNNRRQVTPAYSYGCNNTDDSSSSKSSSKNCSEGGYAGSASSNEDSNETSEQTKKSNEQGTNAKRFDPSSASSSELADFSSGNSDSGSGCSTFISCSDFSDDSRKKSSGLHQAQGNSTEAEKTDANKISNSNNDNNNDLKLGNETNENKEYISDKSLDSSSSLRAVAPVRKQSSKKSRSSTSRTNNEIDKEKRVDISNSNYFVSFKKRKRNHASSSKKVQRKQSNIRMSNCVSRSSSSNALLSSNINDLQNKVAYKHSDPKCKHSQVSSLLMEGYQFHQANLKKNYLDAFTLHENEQKNQHLLKMMDSVQPEKNNNNHTLKLLKQKDTDDRNKDTFDTTTPYDNTDRNETPIYDVGTDIMVQILFFLTHVETHNFLTMPLSKKWCETYMFPQDLWKILCLSPPFYVQVEAVTKTSHGHKKICGSESTDSSYSSGYASSSDQSEDTFSSFPLYSDLKASQIFGVYRLLYSSFVKCVRYLDQIKEDAMKGKTPRGMESSCVLDAEGNKQITKYLADLKEKRGISQRENSTKGMSPSTISKSTASQNPTLGSKKIVEVETKTKNSGKTDLQGNSNEKKDDVEKNSEKKLKPKFSHSKLTERLLGATKHGTAGPVDLPWSCAIYSVVNWMVAFIDVLGIQIMCLKVLPCLLEDEHQRTIAQRAGLTDIVLKGMIMFPNSVQLHTAAFHTIVLLARPLGGREGMLFHQTMVGDSSGILNMSSDSKSNCCKNGIAVMLDSMRRFHANERLQAMSCWSMVNIALISTQKTMLVRLGGISVAANAMMQHPNSADVQFRALFALINLVIPCSNQNQSEALSPTQSNLREIMSESSEKEILDESVGQITNLVVVAMKNFCSSEAIMNRACLVLHNLSLNEQHHTTLLWTPNCYQMLEWAMGNYRYDQVLQQSAGGTLQRLQRTLRGNRDLHTQFSAFIRLQQTNSLEIARREAQLLESRRQERNEAE